MRELTAVIADEVPETGFPMLRSMAMEFPGDPAVGYLDTQYMLGDSLLVAPVFRADGLVRFYLPAGAWTSLLDGATVVGPAWVEQTHANDSLPVLVRPGTVLPLGAVDDRPDYHYADGVRLHLFGIDAPGEWTVRVPGSADHPESAFVVVRTADDMRVSRTAGPNVPWFVVLPEGQAADSIQGGSSTVADGGVTIAAAGADVTLRIR